MKATSLFLMIMIFCSSIFGQDNDLTILNLKGKIITIHEFFYEVLKDSADLQKGKQLYSYYNIFDYDGNKVQDIKYNQDKSVVKKYFYNYENKIRVEQRQFTSEGHFMRKILYKQDNNGNMIENSSYLIDGKLEKKYTFIYDDNNNIIEDNSYNSEGEHQKKYIYKYDEKGNKIGTEIFKLAADFDKKYTYVYNENKDVVEENCYDKKGKVVKEIMCKYIYDNYGNWVQKIVYFSNKPFYIQEREIEYNCF